MPIYRLTEELAFPPPHLAIEDGLLAVGGDLSPERLLMAYQMGIFPWYSEETPILWWSPDPRFILIPGEFHCSRRLRRTIKKGVFSISCDTAFGEVISACAGTPRPGQPGTWITDEMRTAYCRLHELGIAHSVECRKDGCLVGGLYGISLGRAFFGESMFSHVSNASKVALAALVAFAREHGFEFIDCQVKTNHLMGLGARDVPRRTFLHMLDHSLKHKTLQGTWQLPTGFPPA